MSPILKAQQLSERTHEIKQELSDYFLWNPKGLKNFPQNLDSNLIFKYIYSFAFLAVIKSLCAFKCHIKGRERWLKPVIPALWEAEAAGSQGQEIETNLVNMVKPRLY